MADAAAASPAATATVVAATVHGAKLPGYASDYMPKTGFTIAFSY